MAIKIESDVKIERIIKTQRRSIGFQMTDDASLIIRAPFGVSEKTIFSVIHKHKNWIEKKKIEIFSREHIYYPKQFIEGEDFLYLGDYYKLHIADTQEDALKFDGAFYLHSKFTEKARDLFINWYKKSARDKISKRIEYYSALGGYDFGKININKAEKRWGSCTYRGDLNFSFNLIMSPPSVVDYVVVHELAHLREKNHKSSFWKEVEALSPDYKKHRQWLKDNSYRLKI